MTFSVLIPARYASSRLPGKPLADIGGRPMIEHVYRRAAASGARQVAVATDDERVAAAVRAFGGTVCMTGAEHASGTERLAEAAGLLGLGDEDVVVNLQGDEPLMPPQLIRQVAGLLARDPAAVVSTLAVRIDSAAELFDPNVVKVVLGEGGNALYFSRAPVPWHRDGFAANRDELPAGAEYLRHLGIYGYRVGYLRRYVDLAPSPLERIESLEQLRVLWHGGRIAVAQAAASPGPGVDTAQDLEKVRALLA